jgi:hypothetical protein
MARIKQAPKTDQERRPMKLIVQDKQTLTGREQEGSDKKDNREGRYGTFLFFRALTEVYICPIGSRVILAGISYDSRTADWQEAMETMGKYQGNLKKDKEDA